MPWRRVLATVTALTLLATASWEIAARSMGYGPSIDDNPDLWAEQRAKVQPDSIVLVGTSRMLFNADLDVLQRGLGQRPIQLALAGSSPFPVLEDLAQDETFHGTVILDIVPAMFLAPAGPPMEVSQKALQRYREWNHAQRWSHEIGKLVDSRLAFINKDDLALDKLLERIELPERAAFRAPPKIPPYFFAVDGERRGRMVDEAAIIGSPLQQRVAHGWLPLFSPPPPPSFIPAEKFGAMMQAAIEARFGQTQKLIASIRARGGKVVFVRMPVQGPLVEREEMLAPLAHTWARLVRENHAAAVNFADHAELSSFVLPEWSHLSAPDSVEFTKRLVPHLQNALATESAYVAQLTAPFPAGSP
ncbi:MAG: hypothetical protein C0518_09320 [Opitutus sp.]|nr:hypothetical protein [Opitutus sp.]